MLDNKEKQDNILSRVRNNLVESGDNQKYNEDTILKHFNHIIGLKKNAYKNEDELVAAILTAIRKGKTDLRPKAKYLSKSKMDYEKLRIRFSK